MSAWVSSRYKVAGASGMTNVPNGETGGLPAGAGSVRGGCRVLGKSSPTGRTGRGQTRPMTGVGYSVQVKRSGRARQGRSALTNRPGRHTGREGGSGLRTL